MRWTLTIKDQTYGVHTEIKNYECRVTRSGGDVRLSVQNAKPGSLREGRFLMPSDVARQLGGAVLLACAAESEHIDIVFSVDEGNAKRRTDDDMPSSSQDTKWSLSRGNSIGPEVTAAVQRILDAARAPIAWVECRAGLHAIDRGQNALPQETLDAIRKYQVALKGTQGRRRRPHNP